MFDAVGTRSIVPDEMSLNKNHACTHDADLIRPLPIITNKPLFAPQLGLDKRGSANPVK